LEDSNEEVLRKVNILKAETELVYDGKHELVDADYENGAFMSPKLFLNDKPFEKNLSRCRSFRACIYINAI
jgi:oxepin-CoA hydrolase/3-oxo-5,6-dehydrosuberyl-CoA semialdehyde dehydrogenase